MLRAAFDLMCYAGGEFEVQFWFRRTAVFSKAMVMSSLNAIGAESKFMLAVLTQWSGRYCQCTKPGKPYRAHPLALGIKGDENCALGSKFG